MERDEYDPGCGHVSVLIGARHAELPQFFWGGGGTMFGIIRVQLSAPVLRLCICHLLRKTKVPCSSCLLLYETWG